MYTNWQLCTWIGLTLGQLIPNATSWGLDFAMSVTFIGMTIPYLKNRPALLCVTIAGIFSIFTYPLPHKIGLILSALAGIAAGLLSETLLPKPSVTHE